MLRLFLSFLVLHFFLFGHGQTIEWLNSMGGPEHDRITGVSVLPNGNLIISLNAKDTLQIDPEVEDLWAGEGKSYGVIAAFTPEGESVWHKIISTVEEGSVVFSGHFLGTNGDIFLWGRCDSLADFDPGGAQPAYVAFDTSGNRNFVSKYNQNGDFQWAIPTELTTDIHTDETGNVYLSSIVEHSYPFPFLSGDSVVFIDLNTTDGRIAKRNPEGKLIWEKFIRGSRADGIRSIRYYDGSLFAAGSFSDTVDLDPGLGETLLITEEASGYGAFLVQLDTSGVYQKSYVLNQGYSTRFDRLEMDEDGACYLLGDFDQDMDFDAGPGTFVAANKDTATFGRFEHGDVFLLKLTPDMTFEWVRTFGGIWEDIFGRLALTPDGVVCSGRYSERLLLQQPTPRYIQTSYGQFNDEFVASFSSEGDYRWSISLSTENLLFAGGIASNKQGDIFLGGHYRGQYMVQPAATAENLNLPQSQGELDAFLMKIIPPIVSSISSNEITNDISVSPNPSSGQLNFRQLNTGSHVRISDVRGVEIMDFEVQSLDSNLPAQLKTGTYIISIFDADGKLLIRQPVLVR